MAQVPSTTLAVFVLINLSTLLNNAYAAPLEVEQVSKLVSSGEPSVRQRRWVLEQGLEIPMDDRDGNGREHDRIRREAPLPPESKAVPKQAAGVTNTKPLSAPQGSYQPLTIETPGEIPLGGAPAVDPNQPPGVVQKLPPRDRTPGKEAKLPNTSKKWYMDEVESQSSVAKGVVS